VLVVPLTAAPNPSVPPRRALDDHHERLNPENSRRASASERFILNPQSDDFASGNFIITVGGTAAVTLDPGGAYNNTYTVHYTVASVTINASSTTYGQATLVVAIETNNGSGWVERATFSYVCGYQSSWPPPYPARTCSSWPHEAQAITVSGLGLNSSIRLKAKSFNTTNGAGGSFGIRGGDGPGSNPETYNGVTYTTSDGSPVVDATPYNYDTQDYGRCVAACFAQVNAKSIVPYISLDEERSVALVYNSDRANPRPFVHVNVSPDPGYGQTPTSYRFYVKVNGALVRFANNEDTLRFAYTGSAPVRIGGQLDASSYTTGVYRLQIMVDAIFSSSVITTTLETKLTVVNEGSAPAARGWTVAGVQRLFLQTDSALITEGNGSAVFFAKVGANFISPTGEFSKLALNGSNGWVRSYPDSTKVFFNTAGRMTEARDRFGNSTTITYDGQNRLLQIKDPLNQPITFSYDANGLDFIMDPIGRVTQVTVDANKHLTLILDPDNVGTSFGYDAADRLSSMTDRAGKTGSFVYDTAGKLMATISPPVQYMKNDGSIVTGPLIDSLRAWQRVGVPLGPTSPSFTPPLADTVYARVITASFDTSRFTITRWGQPIQSRDPLGRVTTTLYDSRGLPIRVTYPTGASDSAAYNGDGLATFRKSWTNGQTNMRYTGWGLVDSVWGPGQVATRSFVSNGKVDAVRIGSTSTTGYQYDARGRVTQVTDPMGHVVKTTYYTTGQQNRWKDSLPAGRITSFLYDSYGRKYSTSQTGAPTTTLTFDDLNRVTETYDGVHPSPTRYFYDSVNLRSVTDVKGQVYSFEYDALGRMSSRIDPLGIPDRYLYDAAGNVRRWWNRRGDSTDFVYDRTGRLIKKFGPRTATDSVYYSADDRQIVAFAFSMNPTWQETSYLDLGGRPDSVRTILNAYAYTQRYRYAPAGGRVDSVSYTAPVGLALLGSGWAYNTARGTLDSLRFGTGWTSFGVSLDGVATADYFPTGSSVERAISPIHNTTMVQILTDSVSQTPYDLYSYDFLGRIRQHHVLQGSNRWGSHYGYDQLGSLVADSSVGTGTESPTCVNDPNYGYQCPGTGWGPNMPIKSYAYDDVGNRTDLGATYTPGSDRLTAFDGCTFTNDADGNMTSRTCGNAVTTYYWSSDNKLDSLHHVVGANDFGMERFFYDANGNLAKSVTYTGTSYLLWSPDNLVAVLNDQGAAVTEYSHHDGLDVLHAQYEYAAAMMSYFVLDPRDSPLVLKAADESENRPTPDVWGRGDVNTFCPFFGNEDKPRVGWKGALAVDCSGDELYFFRRRWYQARTGRFMSEDPAGLQSGVNPYVFVGNDPINGRDPTGLCHEGMSHPSSDNEIPMPCVFGRPASSAREQFMAIMELSCHGWSESCINRYWSNYDYQGYIPSEEVLWTQLPEKGKAGETSSTSSTKCNDPNWNGRYSVVVACLGKAAPTIKKAAVLFPVAAAAAGATFELALFAPKAWPLNYYPLRMGWGWMGYRIVPGGGVWGEAVFRLVIGGRSSQMFSQPIWEHFDLFTRW